MRQTTCPAVADVLLFMTGAYQRVEPHVIDGYLDELARPLFGVSTPARLAATALLVLAAQLGLAACLAWHLARPASSARRLPALRLWLLRNAASSS